MCICTFLGHSDASEELESKLMSAIENLIKNRGVCKFYVGNQGNFDAPAKKCLIRLKDIYKIECYVVLAYFPNNGKDMELDTIYPEGLERVMPKYAISQRNRWLIEHSEYVVAFVNRSFGGAARIKALAERKDKKIINLAK